VKYIKKYKIFESNSEWSEVDNKLVKDLEFLDFNQALQFVNKMARVCQTIGHHPEINWVYNKIKLNLSTHDAGDIVTEKDENLAKEIDEILKEMGKI